MTLDAKITSSNMLIAKRVLAARRHIEEIEDRDELTEDAKDERIAETRKWLLDSVDEIEANAKAALEKARSKQTTLTPEDSATAIRARDRVKALIDHGTDPDTVVQQLASAGDREGLAVLREEWPAWAQLNGLESTAASTLAAIAQAEEPLLGEKEIKRRNEIAEAERAFSMVQTNLSLARLDKEAVETLYGDSPADNINLAA